MQYKLITSAQQLATFCLGASQCSALAVDTEFVRTRTMTPQLGLIQLYDGHQLVLVDPIAIDDFSPLCDLLTSPSIVKLFHSCSEDLEAFLTALNVIPCPVFDTQLAATLLCMGNSLGYAKLVEKQLGIVLDKGESRTDWLARPLSDKQLSYAANDVLYLWQIYPELAKQADEKGITQWIYDEVSLTADKKSTPVNPEFSYLKLKNAWQLQGTGLLVLQQLSAWRLEKARSDDISLNFIVKETAMLDIANIQPTSMSSLNRIPDLSPRDIRRHGRTIIDIVANALSHEETLCPNNIERLVDFSTYKKQCQRLREACRLVAEKHDIPVELLASKKQINQFLSYCWMPEQYNKEYPLKPDLTVGWRHQLLEQSLARIMQDTAVGT